MMPKPPDFDQIARIIIGQLRDEEGPAPHPLDDEAPDRLQSGPCDVPRATAQPLTIRRVETEDGRLVPKIARDRRRRAKHQRRKARERNG